MPSIHCKLSLVELVSYQKVQNYDILVLTEDSVCLQYFITICYKIYLISNKDILVHVVIFNQYTIPW